MTLQDKHHKHPPLARPKRGSYHACEWAIYGTTCSKIEGFYQGLEEALAADFQLLFVDAEHGETDINTKFQVGVKQYTLSHEMTWNEYDDRLSRFPADAVFVNGNHYPASQQIVFLDPKKKDSLERRVGQLDAVKILIKEHKEQAVFDFLVPKITPETRIFTLAEETAIQAFIQEKIMQAKPPLKALILAGGKSKRMGEDKANLVYHAGQPQEQYVAGLCKKLGLDSYISKAATFGADSIGDIPVIKDRMVDMGPFGAILSAMMHEPDTAWLVLACDLPFLDTKLLEQLIAARDASQFATAVKSAKQAFPEPLIAIYEPKSYARFLNFLSLGYACPRKVLINSAIKIVELADDKQIKNVNTPEERAEVLRTQKK